MEGEIGDLSLQTVYHTQMGEEAGHFSFQSVVPRISDKMVARQPHVFGDESRDKTVDQQIMIGRRSKPPKALAKTKKARLTVWRLTFLRLCRPISFRKAQHTSGLIGRKPARSSLKSLYEGDLRAPERHTRKLPRVQTPTEAFREEMRT